MPHGGRGSIARRKERRLQQLAERERLQCERDAAALSQRMAVQVSPCHASDSGQDGMHTELLLAPMGGEIHFDRYAQFFAQGALTGGAPASRGGAYLASSPRLSSNSSFAPRLSTNSIHSAATGREAPAWERPILPVNLRTYSKVACSPFGRRTSAPAELIQAELQPQCVQ